MPTIKDISGGAFSLIVATDTAELIFPNLTAMSGAVNIQGNVLLTEIVFGAAPVFSNTNLIFKDNALTQAAVDHILAVVNSNGTSNGTLDLSGVTNADPSVGAIPDIEALLSRGWTILTAHEIRITDNLLVRVTGDTQIRSTT